MRIRTKIAIIYTQLTFMVLLGALAFVYVMTTREADRSFYDHLWQRAVTIAQYHFEADEMVETAYATVRESYTIPLPEEQDCIFDASLPAVADSLKKVIRRDYQVRQLLDGHTIEFQNDGRQSIGIYYPDNEGNFILLVSAYNRAGATAQRQLLELLLAILVVGTLLVFLVGLFYARQVMSPVAEIIKNVRRITANNLRRSLREPRGNDELSELSRTFNEMIERLRNSFDMQNAFIRNASHELKNPLTAILGETEIALSKPRSEAEYIKTLETVLVETERLDSVVKDLLTLAQTDFDFSRIPKERVDLVKLLVEVKESLSKTASCTIEIRVEEPRSYILTGVGSLIKISLLNVVGNACKFSAGKPVSVSVGTQKERIVVRVADQGIGIPPGEVRHIFNPFYRAGNTASYKGTGIGLALTQKIVTLHGGKISIQSEINKGTTITLRFTPEED